MNTSSLGRTSLALLLGALPAPAQSLLATFVGDDAGDFMQTVAGGHDLNGDGVDDLVLGSPGDAAGGAFAGAVQAVSGATGAVIWSQAGTPGALLGSALTLVPDMNGDGLRDVLVGAPGHFLLNAPGSVTVYSGATGATVLTRTGTQDHDGLGTAVAGDFDHNGDGVADIAAGAPLYDGTSYDQGYIRVWSGTNGLSVATFYGDGTSSNLGAAMAGVGDIDGDGFDDLVGGEPNHSGGGGRYNMYLGWGTSWHSTTSPKRLGSSFAPAGDVDGDGQADFLVGAPGDDTNGTDSGSVLLRDYISFFTTFYGDNAQDQLGSSLAGLGDVDGDGFGDWAFGAPESSTGLGHVHVYSGRFQTRLYERTGDVAGEDFGLHVAGVGDQNGDGVPDLAVGTPGHDAGAKGDTGRVQIFSGGGPGFVNYCTAGVSASGCIASLSGSGTPSALLTVPFTLAATSVEGDKGGLFFFGWNDRQANPWGNGTSFNCVAPPVKRTPLQSKNGTPGACDGSSSFDLNAHWQANPNKNPGAGAVVQAQFWFRDSGNGSNQSTSMSDALEFVVGP